ncbi:VOC family protein [Streptomyces smyrnaeus]|uniref:VOC family protein n=1 Tax=Streptomyces smyrnaeus TaxID=1387713 RepID=A0ABS3XSA6_9ACTN|nr:VOC family protein [Streptomyces smyrnaeus]MBO8198284.1 VOC family protein [Streptomyces smyrnaeus]
MQLSTTTLSLTVDDVAASRDFFVRHFGYKTTVEADGFASLSHEGPAVDLVFLARGIEVLPPDQRDQHAAGLILAFTVTGLEAEQERLRAEGAPITMPLREDPWGERLFQTKDPNGVVVQLVEWVTPAGDAPESAD